MSLKEDIVNSMSGYSKALYSTWFYYKPARLLLDAGEGVSCALQNFIFGIERILLSHGHYDHIGGLPGVVHSRASAMGDREKPLSVIYPKGDPLVAMMQDYVARSAYEISYDLRWEPLEPGARIALDGEDSKMFLSPFQVNHARRGLCLGYNLVEQRQRLKSEYADLSQAEIAQIARQHGRQGLMEPYEKILLAYGGDSMPLDPISVRGAEVLMHDATFLDSKDREDPTHATMEEAFRVAVDAEVSALVLFHVSSRYRRDAVMENAERLRRQCGFAGPVFVARSRRIVQVQ